MKVQHGCHLSHLTGLWNAAAFAMLLLYREIYFTSSNYSYRRVELEKSARARSPGLESLKSFNVTKYELTARCPGLQLTKIS